MYIEGRRILNSRTLLTNRRKTLGVSFEIGFRSILDGADRSDEELIAALTARYSLEPLIILPTRFDGQDFQEVHRGVPGLTETFFAFNRDVPYTGDQSLWSFSLTTGSMTDLRMRFSARGDATIRGYCTPAERATIDIYLEQKVDYVRRFVLPHTAKLIGDHNTIVAARAASYVCTNAWLLNRYRKEIGNRR